jgi:hypothetical protein
MGIISEKENAEAMRQSLTSHCKISIMSRVILLNPNASMKDRVAINMKAWEGSIFAAMTTRVDGPPTINRLFGGYSGVGGESFTGFGVDILRRITH